MGNALKKIFDNYAPLIKTVIFIIAVYVLPGLVYLTWIFIIVILVPYLQDTQKRTQAIVALSILSLLSLSVTWMTAECYSISNAEKGISPEEILKCRLLSLYNPTGARISGTFSDFPVIINIFQSLGSALVGLIALTISLIHKNKRKR